MSSKSEKSEIGSIARIGNIVAVKKLKVVFTIARLSHIPLPEATTGSRKKNYSCHSFFPHDINGKVPELVKFLAIFVSILLSAPSTEAALELFPAPDLPPSPKFKVEVQTGEGWQESYLNFNPARKEGLGAKDQPGRSTSWTTFGTSEPVKLRVTRLSGPGGKVSIRPSRFKITPHPTGRSSVEFTITPGQKLSVEFAADVVPHAFTGPPHGVPCVVDSLMIFADQNKPGDPMADYPEGMITRIKPGPHARSLPVKNLPDIRADRCLPGLSKGKKVVHFLPGIHHLGYWQVPNSVEHLHFSPGVVVFEAIDVLPQNQHPGKVDLKKTYLDSWFQEELRSQFKITGPGILSGAKLPWHLTKDFSYFEEDIYWSHIKLLQIAAKEIILEDLTMVDSPYWVLSFINDTDSRSRGRFENFKMLGAWTYNNDGLPVPGGSDSVVRDAFIHANDDTFKLYNSNARVENCVVWQGPNGATFQLGWFPKSVSNVHLKRIDLIHNENWYGVSRTNRAVINFADATGKGLIEDFHFENIFMEGPLLRLFDLSAGGDQIICNFTFTNLHAGPLTAGHPGSRGRNHFSGKVSNFKFNNCTAGGKRFAIKR